MAKNNLMVGKKLKFIAIFMILLVLSIPFVHALDHGANDGQSGGDDVDTGAGAEGPGTDDGDTNSDDEDLEEPVVLDTIPPTVTISSVKGQTTYGELDYTAEGSLIEVTFSISDDVDDVGSLSSEIKFTYSDGSTSIGTVSCADNICTGLTSSSVPSAGVVSIQATAKDSSDNEGSATASINAAPLLSGNESNYWDSAVTISPSTWDREVSSFVNQKAYIEVSLSDGPQNLYSADFKSCLSASGTGANASYRGEEYLQNKSYISSSDDMTKHYFLFTAKTDDVYDFDGIKMNCTFSINSYSESAFAPNEVESVIVTIPFYNNPAGMATNATIDKINSAKEETEGWLETMDDIYEWVKVLEYVCKIYQGVRAIIGLVTTVGGTLSSIGKVGENTPIVGPIFKAIKMIGDMLTKISGQADGLINNQATAYIESMCAWVNCEFGLFTMLEKWGVDMEFEDYISEYNDPTILKSDDQNSKLSKSLDDMSEAGVTIFDTDNIVYQFLNMCVPGLLKKVHEWRAIKCTYVLCLVEQTETGMIDESICETIKNSQECEYLLKIFNFIPFSGLMEMVYGFIQEFWASEIEGKIFMAASLYCDITYNKGQGEGWAYMLCAVEDQWTKLQNSVEGVQKMFDSKNQYFAYTADNDKACEDMDDALSKFDESQESFGDTTNVAVSGDGGSQ